MKRQFHCQHSRSIKRTVFLSTTVPFLIVTFFLMPACTTLRKEQSRSALETQMYSDMMYGADDYFGQNNDLAYADSVVPTVQKVVVTSQQSSSVREKSAPPPPPPPPVVVTGSG
jgi:hypothetical protein